MVTGQSVVRVIRVLIFRASHVALSHHHPSFLVCTEGDDGSVLTDRARSAASSMSSVTDCSGSRGHAASYQCDDRRPRNDDDETRHPVSPAAVAPAPANSRVCVVQGLLRTNDDSGLASEVPTTRIYIHCVSKNDSDVGHYDFNAHRPILVIFGRDIAERICY